MRSLTGPVAEPRTSLVSKLPKGTRTLPDQVESEGRSLAMLMTPPSVLRPKSALCGPRTNSTCSTPLNSMFDEFAFSCGTPSMYVVIPGLAGLEPTPRKYALLSLRAENSLNHTLGA